MYDASVHFMAREIQLQWAHIGPCLLVRLLSVAVPEIATVADKT